MKNIINGVLIIIGSSIGAGILGMPITSSLAGFIPSAIIMIAVAIYMAEISKIIIILFNETKINDLTIIFKEKISKNYYILGVLIYTFLFLSIMAAYISKSGDLLQLIVNNLTKLKININLYYALILVATMIIIKSESINFNNINKILTIFLLSILILILIQCSNANINLNNITYINLQNVIYVYPILITSFGFHNILPYINNENFFEKKYTNKIINIGVITTLTIYLIWIFFILMLKNNDNHLGELELYNSDKIITEMVIIKNNKMLTLIVFNTFSLLAILTSIFSIAISMKIFLQKIMPKVNISFIIGIILLPPIIIIKIKTNIFFSALEISGSIFTLIIFGLLPIKALKIIKKKNLFKINFLYIITSIIIIVSILIQLNKLK